MTTRWLSSDEQRAWRSYLVGTTLLMDRLDRDLRDKHDLSMPEYEIMVLLSEAPDHRRRMAEIADAVKNSRSRITHTVARLERAGLVAREQCLSDGRGVLAILTDAGYAKLQKAAPDHVASVRAVLIDIVDDDDLLAVGRVFASVTNVLDKTAYDPRLLPEVPDRPRRSLASA